MLGRVKLEKTGMLFTKNNSVESILQQFTKSINALADLVDVKMTEAAQDQARIEELDIKRIEANNEAARARIVHSKLLKLISNE